MLDCDTPCYSYFYEESTMITQFRLYMVSLGLRENILRTDVLQVHIIIPILEICLTVIPLVMATSIKRVQ